MSQQTLGQQSEHAQNLANYMVDEERQIGISPRDDYKVLRGKVIPFLKDNNEGLAKLVEEDKSGNLFNTAYQIYMKSKGKTPKAVDIKFSEKPEGGTSLGEVKSTLTDLTKTLPKKTDATKTTTYDAPKGGPSAGGWAIFLIMALALIAALITLIGWGLFLIGGIMGAFYAAQANSGQYGVRFYWATFNGFALGWVYVLYYILRYGTGKL